MGFRQPAPTWPSAQFTSWTRRWRNTLGPRTCMLMTGEWRRDCDRATPRRCFLTFLSFLVSQQSIIIIKRNGGSAPRAARAPPTAGRGEGRPMAAPARPPRGRHRDQCIHKPGGDLRGRTPWQRLRDTSFGADTVHAGAVAQGTRSPGVAGLSEATSMAGHSSDHGVVSWGGGRAGYRVGSRMLACVLQETCKCCQCRNGGVAFCDITPLGPNC